MVRSIKKLFLALLACVAIAQAIPTQAQAQSVYSGDLISPDALGFFRDTLNAADLNTDYVVFCSGDGVYTLAIGDLTLAGSSFTGDSVDLYTYSAAGYSVSHGVLDLEVGDFLVYSNLGKYPTLIERGSLYEFSTILLLCVGLIAVLIHSIFSFSYRNRNGS